MTALQDQIATALRDYITDGVPASGAYTPLISDLRTILNGMAVGSQWISAIGDVSTGFLNAASTAAARTAIGLGSGDAVTFDSATIAGSLTVDTSTLKVDAPNNRVGIGTASPTYGLHVALSAYFGLDVSLNSTITVAGNATFDGGTLFVDAANNKVGIGTTSPSGYALCVESGGVGIISADDNFPALSVTQSGGGVVALFEDTASVDSTPVVITTAGTLVKGYTTTVNSVSGVIPGVQAHGVDSSSNISATRWSSDATGPALYLTKSRGSSVGTRGGLSINDALGSIYFGGDDGTNFIAAAQLLVEADATPGTNDMGGRFIIKTTPDGSATPAERMRIDSSGFMSFGGDLDAGFAHPGDNEMAIWAAGQEMMRFSETGQIVVGTTDALTSWTTAPRFQVVGNSSAAQIGLWRASDDTVPPYISTHKARNTLGSPQAVLDNDYYGAIAFAAHDGTGYIRSALIQCRVSGTVATNQIPSDMRFLVANTSGTLTTRLMVNPDGEITPGSTNTQKLGSSTARWTEVFATNGTINTSDAREKEWLGPIDHYAMRAANEIMGGIGSFVWKDGNLGRRRHIGVTAQAVQSALARNVANADGLALVDDSDDVLGLRYDQLSMLLIAALDARLKVLEAR